MLTDLQQSNTWESNAWANPAAGGSAATPANGSPCDLLRPYRVPVLVLDAIEYLQTSTEALRILALYQHYFPDQFERSKATKTALLPPPGAAWSEAELEFFQYVDERLFPINSLWWEDERITTIPVLLASLEWWERDWSDFQFGWQFMFKLCGARIIPDIELEGATEEVREALRDQVTADRERLRQRGAEQPAPLCYLPLALDMIEHDTGVGFLDLTPENPIDLHWRREDVDFLIEEWREAKGILSKVGILLDEIESGPESQMKVIELWRSAQSARSTNHASGGHIQITATGYIPDADDADDADDTGDAGDAEDTMNSTGEAG